jgi:hypothetical protein
MCAVLLSTFFKFHAYSPCEFIFTILLFPSQDSGAYSEGEHKRPMSEVLDELVEAEGVDLGEVWNLLSSTSSFY